MADYNIKMHQIDDDGVTVHNLYPKSKAELIEFADGTTLDSARTSVEVNITLSTTWDVGTGSYTQTFSNPDLTENSIIDLRIADNATDAQIDAFNALDLIDGGQTNGSFTIKCRSDVLNSISIPLTYTATIVKMALIDDGTASSLETNINTHKARTDNPHSVTKSQVGLGNVDNTSDADKPISTATQTALDSLDSRLDLKERYLTSTIPTTGWSGTAPYSVAVTVSGLTDSRPDINPIYSTTLETARLEKEAWNTIGYIDCTANTMTVTCLEEIPTTAINVELVGG